MNAQNIPSDLSTESRNKQKVTEIESFLAIKNNNKSNHSQKNIKSNLSKIKSDKSILDNILGSHRLNKCNRFMPKGCNIQCSEYDVEAFSSEEEEEMGKGLNKIGKELKQRLFGMEAGIKDNDQCSSKKLRLHSSHNLKKIKLMTKSKKKKKKSKKNKNLKKQSIHKIENELILSPRTSRNNEKYRVLQKIKNIFDSMDEDEIINDLNEGNIIFEIDGNFIFIFDSLILFSSLFSFFYIPISIAKSDCFCMNENYYVQILQILIEILYFLDIIVTFFREYYDSDYKLNKNNMKIAIHYIRSQLKFDLIETLPFSSINSFLCSHYDKFRPDGSYCLYNGIDGKFIVLKLMKCLKILKIAKAMSKRTNIAIYKLSEYMSENSWGEKYFKMSVFLLLCILGLNIFVCFHIFIGKQSYPNWIILVNQEDASFFSLYISSLYFLLETFTTVGYGDIYCSCLTEYLFQILLLSVGIVAYSYLITIIGNYVNNESQAQIKHQQKLTLLEEIRIEYPQMPFKLYRKMQQHLESISHQQKKCDFNILVNSLPYSIKNLVLFKVYDKQIKNFRFFKDCSNTDYISKVFTCFIPVFSKKNAFIIHEDEIVENIVFVKEGSLTLKVAINIHHQEESIRKILYEKFSDIPDIKNACDHRRSIEMCNSPVKNEFQSAVENKSTGSIVSKRVTIIEQEIGKVDMGCDDIEDGRYKFLKILNISKNENYGMIYMFLNKPSPLSLRVRSKRAEIFLLRKQDSFKIAKAYPNIWKKQFKNSFFNMIAIKQLTFKILRSYCSLYSLTINQKQFKETGKIALSRIKEIVQKVQTDNILQEKKEEKKVVIRSKNSSPKNHIKQKKSIKFRTSLYNIKESHKIIRNNLLGKSSGQKLNKYNENEKQIQKNKNKLDIIRPENSPSNKIARTRSFSSDKKQCYYSSYENEASIMKSDAKKEEEIKIEKIEKEYDISNEKTDVEKNKSDEKMNNINNALENFREMFFEEINSEIKNVKTKKLSKKNNKEYYKLLSIKLVESLNKLLEAFNQICKIKMNSINNINNSPIISTFNTYLKFPNSINLEKEISKLSSLITVDNSFSKEKLTISPIASFNYESNYNNLNEISNGDYIFNKSLQDQTQKFVKSFNNNISKINYTENHSSDESNNKARKKSFSVKTIKSDISKNINFDDLKQKGIIKEIPTAKKKLNNVSCFHYNKYIQKNNLNQENKNINEQQPNDNQNIIKVKVDLFDKNSNILIKKENSEIEYEFSNEVIKDHYTKISDILDKNKETKKKKHSGRNNILAELNNLQIKENMRNNDKSIDDMIKKNAEINNSQIKEFGIKRGSNNSSLVGKKCNIY